MNIGLAQGLAVSGDYDKRISDSRYQQQMMKQQDALNDAKRRMFESDIEYQQGGNAFDQPIVKKVNQQITQQIGDYVADNPDWDTNFQKRAYVKQLKNSLKDNPDVLRALSTNENRNALLKYAQEAKQKGVPFDEDKLNEELMRYQNYEKFGNPDGPEALQNEGMKAYLFSKPVDFVELGKVGAERGNKFKGAALDIKYLNNGRDGAYTTVPKEDLLNAEAVEFYKERKRQFDVYYTSKGIDPIQKAKEFITSGIETKFDIGDKNTLRDDLYKLKYANDLKRAGEAAAQGGSAYAISLVGPGRTVAAPTDLAETFGSDVPHYYTDALGKITKNVGDVFHYEGDIHDKGFREDGKYQKTGVKHAPGFIYKPLEFGKESGFTYDPWGPGSDVIKPEFKDKVQIVDSPVNDKGESFKVLKIKAIAELDANNPYYEAKFNKMFMTNKQREGVGINEGVMKEQLFQDANGNLFNAQGQYRGPAQK